MAYVTAHGKRIKVRFRIRGAEYVTTINFNPTQANLRAARSRCRDLEARLRAGEPWEDIRGELREERGVRARTLGQYMQHYFDTAQDIERTTLVKYLETYNRVWSVFDGRDIATIRKPELLKRLATFRYSAKMRRNAISVLRKGFDVAKEEGYLSSAPTDHWKVGKVQRPPKDPYTPAERDALLSALQGVYKAFFSVAFYTGMRTGELLALQPRHLSRPFITVEQERVSRRIEHRTKTKQAREAHLPAHVWPLLEPYRFQEWLFQNEHNRPFTQANALLDEFWAAHEAAGVRRRTGKYPWRSSYVSHALMQGIHPGKVARQTGHNEQTMWTHYAEFIPSGDDRDEFEKAFGDTKRDQKGKEQA